MNQENMPQVKRTHTFHAEAGVLHARLQLPLKQDIKPQAFSKLPTGGGYLSQHAHNYQLEGIVSYRAAYTQVAGNKDVKEGPRHGWTTVATAVVEHLNVLDVVTADRVVAQISTDHPLEGYVPHISFLGTRFENLRIAGHKVDIDLDLLGTGADENSAHEGNKGLMERIDARNQEFNDPEWLPDWYEEFGDFFDPLGAVPHEDEGVDPKLPDVVVKGSLVRTSKFPSPKDSYPGGMFRQGDQRSRFWKDPPGDGAYQSLEVHQQRG